MVIRHASVNWNLEDLNPILKKSKTLVLGSFNPNNINPNENTDFYYGRSTNHFWKSITRNLNLIDDYFTGNLQNKIDCMVEYGFFFFDIISSIELECDDEDVLNQYVNQHIYTNFSDKELFKVRPRSFQNNTITKDLNYNQFIIDALEQNQITKIIHTLGNSRIDQNLMAKPSNINFGFRPFVTQIADICNNNAIHFNPTSFSPSQIAVNRGGPLYRDNLDNWINQNVLIL